MVGSRSVRAGNLKMEARKLLMCSQAKSVPMTMPKEKQILKANHYKFKNKIKFKNPYVKDLK